MLQAPYIMNQILFTLFQALAKMPLTNAPAANIDMLLTLLFWKLMSDCASGKLARWQSHHHQPDDHIRHLWQQNQLEMDEQSQYAACHWRKPNQAGLALRNALYRWHTLQNHRLLLPILRPERFCPVHPKGASFRQSSVLAEVATLIGSIDTSAANLSAGEIFSKALQTLRAESDDLPKQQAQLVASLLNPSPIATVYQPDCASAQLLLACANQVARQVSRHELQLYAQEPQADLWALAKMQLLAHGLTLHQVEHCDALSTPMLTANGTDLLAADVVLLHLRADTAKPTALIWQAMRHLKHDHSQLALVLPLTLLDSAEGHILRRHLITQKQLAAVIELPGPRQPAQALLLIQPFYPSNLLAFISGKMPEPGERTPLPRYDVPTQRFDEAAIHEAWRAFHENRPAPWLRLIDDDTIAQHNYALHLSAYSAWLGKPRCNAGNTRRKQRTKSCASLLDQAS